MRHLLVILSLLLSMVGVATANAQEASTIDASRTGTLIVHKYSGDPLTQYGDPTNPNANPNREPVSGIDFTIQPITDVDLTTNDGWQKLAATKVTDYYAGGSREKTLGAARTATTDANGDATFSDIPLGAYLVTEVASSAGRRNLTVAAPFVVTVPMTNPDNRSEWMYTVEVQAKDQELSVTKAADRTCVELGDTVTFGISATLPAPDRNGAINRIEIADPLAPELSYVDDSSTVVINDTTLKTEDYTISVDGNVVTLKLTDSGLATAAALRTGKPDTALTWSFKAKVADKDIPAGTKIDNRAYFLPEGYPEFNTEDTPGVPSNRVRIRVGNCVAAVTPIPTPVPDPNLPPEPTTPGSHEPTSPDGTDTTAPPASPGNGSDDSSGGSGGFLGGLASTGADVLWALGIGSVLILVGAGMVIARRRQN